MKYDNYIFDLYGTLVDIHTDEHNIVLWRKVAGYIKREFGVRYKPSDLRKRYKEIYKDEVRKLSVKLNLEHPEIRVSWVWDRLLAEGAGIDCASDRNGNRINISKNRRRTQSGPEALTPRIPASTPNDGPMDEPSPEIEKLCIFFRETSTDKMKLYPGTEQTLQTLRDSGKKVYLLSNAQRSFTWKEIQELGLEKYFDDIFISSDKMIMKPQRQFMEMLIDKHALVREKCVMIGNEIGSDMKIAADCEIDGIFLNTCGYSGEKIEKDLGKLNISIENDHLLIISDGDIRKIL
ncbi:HAD family hydrolase [Butyrivibrio sp. AE2032]|uniref:HAD family hydrolase n=1 Tax=Butyrivibrio sp. AE2032 TaxID=1458463 RepID=UPI00163A0397|nr:HAD family hydrolase [Butyrivibrio sp. AE2032]